MDLISVPVDLPVLSISAKCHILLLGEMLPWFVLQCVSIPFLSMPECCTCPIVFIHLLLAACACGLQAVLFGTSVLPVRCFYFF